MTYRQQRILIIDDQEEEGIKIAKAIWMNNYSALFIKYDPEILTQSSG